MVGDHVLKSLNAARSRSLGVVSKGCVCIKPITPSGRNPRYVTSASRFSQSPDPIDQVMVPSELIMKVPCSLPLIKKSVRMSYSFLRNFEDRNTRSVLCPACDYKPHCFAAAPPWGGGATIPICVKAKRIPDADVLLPWRRSTSANKFTNLGATNLARGPKLPKHLAIQ